jgi:hypothetical protein
MPSLHLFMTMVLLRRMVSLIPRISSWAVSGTPAKVQVADLMHLLKYVLVVSFACLNVDCIVDFFVLTTSSVLHDFGVASSVLAFLHSLLSSLAVLASGKSTRILGEWLHKSDFILGP